MEDVEKRVIGKVMRRLIPFLILCYFVAYLDRVNVSFAKLHMNQALGFSDAAFGLGAGLFFIAYFLFEVPSNIFLERVGARLWIARIMISWGIVSAAFAFIPSISAATGVSNEGVFYTLRLLLGAFEAGFFPGIIFYLTLWFPAVPRSSNQLLYAGDPNFVDRWGTDLRVIAQRVWLGAGRLAMAIHSRGVAIGSSGILRVVLFDRFSAPGPLAAERRNCVAGERASNREKKQGEG
jgi:MFS family permease